MKNTGLGTILGISIVVVVIIWLFKILISLGVIASFVALIYFGVQSIKNKDSRKDILLKRVLPSFVILLVCAGISGSMNTDSSPSTKSTESSSKVESSKSKDDESSNEESKDDSSSEDYDSSDEDTNEQSDSTETSTNENNSDTTTGAKGDMTTDQQGTIVGNSLTMIYHTPDQRGYRMNSANAVHFNTEAEAQAAGYRKSEK